MNRFTLFLALVFLSGSTLFASKNRPIYTVKDGECHRSTGPNQDQCSKSTYYGGGLRSTEEKKCNDCNDSKNDSKRK